MDTETLQKGDVIPPEHLEKLFGAERTTPEYRLQLVELHSRIQEESYKQGRPLLCRTDKEALVVMTDAEAVGYKACQHRQAVRKLYRSLRHLNRIDTNKLTAEEVKKHEREVINQSRIAQAVKHERKKLV